MTKVGWVYAIDVDGIVKVGFSTNPRVRLSNITTTSPAPPTVLALIKGGRKLEKALHRRFRRYRVHREWFDLPEPQRAELLRMSTHSYDDLPRAGFEIDIWSGFDVPIKQFDQWGLDRDGRSWYLGYKIIAESGYTVAESLDDISEFRRVSGWVSSRPKWVQP